MQQNIAPTKTNLMLAESALKLSKKGYELLDRKRNVLIRELMGLVEHAENMQTKVNEIFRDAYEALQIANVTLGITEVYELAMSVPEATDFKVLTLSVMGAEIPKISFQKQEIEHYYSFFHTNTALDVAVQKFHDVKYLIYELAEIEDTIFRLAFEIKRTQKRANALYNIQIPKYENIVKQISEIIEEKEREDFFRLKVLKKK
ncbi:MAG: V-type ATP synthase subunit D, partial [Thermoanaerobacterales bacterium]|nr:V-type ATP synthase subunit D [Thermoanaerobacterales bacterium]